jgi:MoaA/NifB/PqqE/SkfB family radical SAM enzyme
MQSNKEIIRKTTSVCPVCLEKIEAEIIEQDSSVYLEKKCNIHGDFRLLLSRHPEYYKKLDDFYFSIMNRNLPQRDYIVHLTNKCELNCPICLAGANLRTATEYPLESLKQFLKGKKGYKIDLMGAEPAARDDLPEIIRAVSESGNIAALHTNGIRASDYSYMNQLKKEGLKEVHLQFDGFDDCVYEKIRGRKLLEIKLKTLDNLEKLNISTDLVATIVRGINENQMSDILNFGVEHGFVKEIFFLGCRFIGKAKDLPIARCIMPDELIDILEEQTKKKISRRNIFNFQKLYFTLLSAFSIRKCFYIQHFLIARDKNGYVPVDQLFDLEGIQKKLGRFKELRLANKRLALPYLFSSLAFSLTTFKSLFWLNEFVSFGYPFVRGFNLARLPRKSILLGFISACDGYSFDYGIAQNCGKGAVSVELGIQDTGAIDNVLRDRLLSGQLK